VGWDARFSKTNSQTWDLQSNVGDTLDGYPSSTNTFGQPPVAHKIGPGNSEGLRNQATFLGHILASRGSTSNIAVFEHMGASAGAVGFYGSNSVQTGINSIWTDTSTGGTSSDQFSPNYSGVGMSNGTAGTSSDNHGNILPVAFLDGHVDTFAFLEFVDPSHGPAGPQPLWVSNKYKPASATVSYVPTQTFP